MWRRHHHLTRAEREGIFRLHDAKVLANPVAQQVDRYASAIYHELRRKRVQDTEAATAWLADRRQTCKRLVTEANRGTLADRSSGQLRVCHGTICQYVYNPEGRRRELCQQLPRVRKSNRRR